MRELKSLEILKERAVLDVELAFKCDLVVLCKAEWWPLALDCKK